MSIIKSFGEFKPLPPTCKKCRTIRGMKLCGLDKKIPKLSKEQEPIHSNIIPGFYSTSQLKESEKKINLLILAESHGGDITFFRKQWSKQEEIEFISSFYLSNENKTFHQQQIKILLNWLEEENISWYFTDLVKCYVKKERIGEKDNFKLALKQCKNYLTPQLKEINAKLILCLGKTVYEAHTGDKLKGSVELNHGELISNKIFSCFPSRNTADLWVKIDGWKKVKQKIKEQLNIVTPE